MGFSIRTGFAALAGATVLCASLDVAAQDLPSVDVRTWRAPTDPNAGLVTEPAVTPGPGVLSFGGFASYALRPVTLRKAGTDDVAFRPVRHVLALDAVANLGIGERFAIGANLPLVLYQEGDKGLPASVSNVDQVKTSAVGDVALSMKGAIVRNEGGGFGLAALGNFTLPTGGRSTFLGEGAPTASARLLAEYTLIVALVQASVGYKLRTEGRSWPSETVGGFRFGDEIPWSIGLAFKPGVLGVDSGNRQRWELGAHGWFPAGPVGPFGAGQPGSAALTPVLLTASDRIEVGRYRDAFFLVGGEIGLTQAVGVPVVRGILGVGWAPREHDMDHDGVRDDIDGCPEIPEDRDGFEDSDGCPEIDDDDDGVLDKEDACPRLKGEESKDPKRNGCPIEDADGDGVDNAVDACPQIKGVKTEDPQTNGCEAKDADRDGIADALDKCPMEAEDKDSYQDDDGCPDIDNDADGILDSVDACPTTKGEPSTDPSRHGCPLADRDGDTFDNGVDKCPDNAEVWNGVTDDDGCPDEGGKLLVTVDEKRNVRMSVPIKFGGVPNLPEVEVASVPWIRALASELNKHPDWTLAVGVRPSAGDDGQMAALARSFAIVRELGAYSHRDGVAESIAWSAVKNRPGSETGVGFLVLTSSAPIPITAPVVGAPRVP